jgi:DNA gyrase/topoisomerase IV subunit A
VTELPYQVNQATLIEKIGELIRDAKKACVLAHPDAPRIRSRRVLDLDVLACLSL